MSDASRLTPHATRIPVIAIDGPSASGKGTVAQGVARRLGFHCLDSGALYRLIALQALRAGIALDDAAALASLAEGLDARFEGDEIYLSGQIVTDEIRSAACSKGASQVAALPALRAALLPRQRALRRPPGLVAEGRDMGTVVFPDAALKVYLTASAEARAERRYKQLMGKGMCVNLPTLLQEIVDRDARDAGRAAAPLLQAADARLLDTTHLTIEEAVAEVVGMFSALHPPGA